MEYAHYVDTHETERLKTLSVKFGMAVTGILGGVFMPKLAGFFTPAVLYLMKISAVDMSFSS